MKLYRVSEPTKQDTAPYKSICIVQTYPDQATFWAQLSKDEEQPNWCKLDQISLEDSLKYLDNL